MSAAETIELAKAAEDGDWKRIAMMLRKVLYVLGSGHLSARPALRLAVYTLSGAPNIYIYILFEGRLCRVLIGALICPLPCPTNVFRAWPR